MNHMERKNSCQVFMEEAPGAAVTIGAENSMMKMTKHAVRPEIRRKKHISLCDLRVPRGSFPNAKMAEHRFKNIRA
jgi:hypothetical protein